MSDRKTILKDRDLAVLRHVLRHRISTPAVIQRVLNLTADAETALARRLITNGYLAQERLFRNQKYYHLTPRAAILLGRDEKVAQPLRGQQSSVNHYAILAFCCLGPVLRERITRLEFLEQFPQFVIRGVMSDQYYRDIDKGVERLGFIRVDHGGEARRIAHKALVDVQDRAATPAFRELLLRPDRGFVIAIVTTNADKAAAIRKELATDNATKAAFRVEVAPGLDLLVEREQNRRGTVSVTT